MSEKSDTTGDENIIISVNDLEIDQDDILGRGGYGQVYRGRFKETGQNVAVKLLIAEGSLPKRY